MRALSIGGFSLVLILLVACASQESQSAGQAEAAGDPSQEPIGVPPISGFALRGEVRRADDKAPLEGIRLSMPGASGRSDAQGRWVLRASLPLGCGQSCEVKAEDVDGAAGGGRFSAGIIHFHEPVDGEAWKAPRTTTFELQAK